MQNIEKNSIHRNDIIEEDEIILIEIFNTILKYKYVIAIFSFIVVSFTLVYVLSIPNSYKSNVILAPQGDNKNVRGDLSSLAGLAGISLGNSGGGKNPFTMIQTTLRDYKFNSYLIEKYDLAEKINNPSNLVFALGFDGFYSKNENNDGEEKNKEEIIYNTYQSLMLILSTSKDKESNLITFSAEHIDRMLAKELVDIYLEEIVQKIKSQDTKELDKQIEYYKQELTSTYDVSLKEQLSKSVSTLMQKKVFSQASDYYFVSKLTDSRVAYIKEKTKPKRALILLVSLVFSLIFGILLVFIIEFIKNNKK